MPKLIPPDLGQCQAIKPNGHTFMTLGGRPGMEQCKNKPVWLATENKPGADGLKGSMTLCQDCAEVLKEQQGETFATLESLK